MLDHVFSVFILPALWCHNCTSPPVKEAHPGKGICATSRFILVSLKLLLNFQQHLSLENTCWAQRWEFHPSQKYPVSLKPKISQRSFSQSSALKLSGLKRSCLSHSRPLISHLFPKKMDPLWERRQQRTFANQPCTTRNGNQRQANVVQYELEKWVCNCSGHLTFPLYCYELKRGNSALNSTFGSVFFFLTWIFHSCCSKAEFRVLL